MKQVISLNINGQVFEVAVEPQRTLLDVLRHDLGLTGTKNGCSGLGQCGTCTVIMDGKAVYSCLVLALDARGREITTIEGVAQGRGLHPVQRAFLEHGAVQCGFCTPGMVLSAKALFDREPHPSEDQIKTAIAGNLCRCTAYAKYKEALLAEAGRGGKERR